MIRRIAVVLCLLSVSFVVTFHTCEAESLGGVPLEKSAAYAGSDEAERSADLATTASCHVCAVVVMDGVSITGQPIHGLVPASSGSRLISTLSETIGPPPRA